MFNVYFKDVCNRTIFLYAGKLTNMFEKHTLHAYQWGIFVLILNKMIVFQNVFYVLFCVIFKYFSAISFLYLKLYLYRWQGVWFYISLDDSFYTYVLTLTVPVQLVTIVYV